MIFDIVPVSKPRMTQRDRWKRRPSVVRFFDFRDEVRRQKMKIPVAGAKVIFTIPMPKSWPKYKTKVMDGKPHQQKPDIDNLLKSVLDCIYSDDSVVYDIRATKRWGEVGKIEVIKGGDECHHMKA